MNPEQQAFLNAIEAEPTNYQLRFNYADWLDANSQPEEANRQRAFPEAETWLKLFAKEINEEYSTVIQAGHNYVSRRKVFCQGSDLSGSNALSDDEDRQMYWKCWSVVTGIEATEDDREGSVFDCDCSGRGRSDGENCDMGTWE